MPDFARRATDMPHPKWRLVVPIIVLLATAGALVLIPRYKSVPGAEIVASVTETDSSASPKPPAAAAERRAAPAAPAPSTGTLAYGPERPEHQRTTTFTLDMMKERQQFKTQQQQWMVQAGFSLIMALASVFIILSKKYPEDCNKWAYSTIAFILGYWLKS